MHITNDEIDGLGRVKRLNIINSITGVKPANLIGTVSESGETNLAIFSSVVHLGSNPPLLAFIMRPATETGRHTYENIRANGFYTINHVHESFIQNAHYTSAKFERGVSEFERCKLTETFIGGFKAPFVKESLIKIGMTYKAEIEIPFNNTLMIIGEVQHIMLPDGFTDEEGHLDLSAAGSVGISGLNSYYSLNKLAQFPYAKPNELPNFGS